MLTADRLVQVEVLYCVSSLVATVASAWDVDHVNPDMNALHEQAQELCMPIEDWEEAARQDGWTQPEPNGPLLHSEHVSFSGSWEGVCFKFDIEPYMTEIYEHWIVSDWLADRLAEKGEKVDKDFAGLTVWARTTAGQGIALDAVIQAIVADVNKGAL